MSSNAIETALDRGPLLSTAGQWAALTAGTAIIGALSWRAQRAAPSSTPGTFAVAVWSFAVVANIATGVISLFAIVGAALAVGATAGAARLPVRWLVAIGIVAPLGYALGIGVASASATPGEVLLWGLLMLVPSTALAALTYLAARGLRAAADRKPLPSPRAAT